MLQHFLQEAHGALDIAERAAHDEPDRLRGSLSIEQCALCGGDDQRRRAPKTTRTIRIEQAQRIAYGRRRRRRHHSRS